MSHLLCNPVDSLRATCRPARFPAETRRKLADQFCFISVLWINRHQYGAANNAARFKKRGPRIESRKVWKIVVPYSLYNTERSKLKHGWVNGKTEIVHRFTSAPGHRLPSAALQAAACRWKPIAAGHPREMNQLGSNQSRECSIRRLRVQRTRSLWERRR